MSEMEAAMQLVYGFLCKRAEAGDLCPTNQEIADKFGWQSMAPAQRTMRALREQGLIEMEPSNGGRRVVTIVATGESTIKRRISKKQPPKTIRYKCLPIVDSPQVERAKLILRRRGDHVYNAQAVHGADPALEGKYMLNGKPVGQREILKKARKVERMRLVAA